jgi:hypothetical protein
MIISYTKLLNNYLAKSWQNTLNKKEKKKLDKLHEWYLNEVGTLEGGSYYGNQ